MLSMPEHRTSVIRRKLETVTEVICRYVSWAAVLLVVATFLVVILRYALQTGSIALQESLIYINAVFFTLGSAYTLKHNGHVRVDIFYNRFSPRRKALFDLFGTAILLIPFCLFIFWASWDYVSLSWQIRERSAETSGLPIVFLLKTTILLLAGILFWQGLAELLRNLELLKTGDTE
jgi:TRAP-type mannitol/chloroaromatic compound transport system permease small subunit